MPELPEVEAAARRLRRALVGRTIVAIAARHATPRRHLPPRIRAAVAGRQVRAIDRRGKHQLLRLDDGATLHVHFRMTGDWVVGRAAQPLPRHARVVLTLDGGDWVALDDPRVLATVAYHAPGDEPALGLGPEPFDRALTPAAWHARLRARRAPIKAVLLDQSVLAGLGNIYAAEALWAAGLRPTLRADRLTRAQATALLAAIRGVLRAAPQGRYWRRADGAPWRVYDRAGAPCPRCGRPIRRRVHAGRSTYWCPGCQR
jgi:formamidopyrimidine-DNA glycosylase